MHTPYFPALRPRLAALGRRSVRALRQVSLRQLQEQLTNCLPCHLFSSADEGLNSRERIFGLRLTFECFVWQMLKPGTSCREVVRQVQALFTLQGLRRIDEGDSAYVQARQRLPRERLEQAVAATAQAADRRASPAAILRGRAVKVVDGSSTQLADTQENQERYPQSATQKKGCGFPVLKFAALFSLASGAILKVVLGSLHQHDLRLLREFWEDLKKGDILLGDRAYGEYTTLATWPARGVDVVARLHQTRKVDFRKAVRLAKHDGLFTWAKSAQPSKILSAEQWAALPAQITVRVIRFTAEIRGFRGRRVTLATTLVDPKLYPAQELIDLYARRWRLELCLRDLKTTMGMEQLRCKSPDMAEKELLACLVAHNLVRCLMAEAASTHQAGLEPMSFKGSVDALRQFSAAIAQARNRKTRRKLWDELLRTLANDLVPHRPGRSEPRAVKRRPKPFPLLTKPRRKYKGCSHRNRCWKARPRDLRKLN